MSIELLPPDPEYPNAYHVRSNWCRCHPETCCCNDWAVHAPDGKKHSTHFHHETADEVADALNHKRSNDQLERGRAQEHEETKGGVSASARSDS